MIIHATYGSSLPLISCFRLDLWKYYDKHYDKMVELASQHTGTAMRRMLLVKTAFACSLIIMK